MDTTNTMHGTSARSIETTALIDAMPKAEIHIHLEGAIDPATLLTLAKRHDRLDTLPANTVAGLQEWFTFRDFNHFIEIYFAISGLLRTPDDFELIAYECGADMHKQNIRYREATITPYTHINLMDKGVTIDDIFAGLDAGRKRAKQDFGVEMRWVFDIPRNSAFKTGEYNGTVADKTLGYAIAGLEHGVIGFGLGGNEVGAPPEPFAHAFQAAQQTELISVPHAGETMGAQSVWGAIDALGAVRLGHGVRAMEDPKLLEYLHTQQIVLEINPTSNICLHVYRRMAEHPLPHLDKMGLLITVNSDDPPLFNTTLCDEYKAIAREFGYPMVDLARLARNAFSASAAPQPLKAEMLAEFDDWVAQNVAHQAVDSAKSV